MRDDRIPVGPFREEALRLHAAGVEWSVIAFRCGYVQGDGTADISRLHRRLGITPVGGRIAEAVAYATGVTLARGLGLDPVDVGV